MRRDERGFNLINILVAAGVAIALIAGTKLWFSYREHETVMKAMLRQSKQIRERIENLMNNDDAWRATMMASENQADMACLRRHDPCPHKASVLSLRDNANRLAFDPHTVANGISAEGNLCGSFSEAGNDGCPFRLDLTWEPNCSAACADPDAVVLRGHLKFRPGSMAAFSSVRIPDQDFSVMRDTHPAVPRNCYELLQAGHNQDAVYVVRPDPHGPPMSVYCDQTRDGGGWALALSTGSTTYTSIPDTSLLTPGITGRLRPELIKQYLDASSLEGGNNLRLELPDVDGGLVLGASTNGAIDGDSYSAPMPPGDCRKVPDIRNEATHQPAPAFGIFFSGGGGEVGLDDATTETEGYHGIRVCFGTTPSGRVCGNGCHRKWTGELFHQKGTVWIR